MEFYLDYDMSYADDLDDDWSYDLDEQYSHTHLDYAELTYRHYALSRRVVQWGLHDLVENVCMVICANTHEIMQGLVAHIRI